MKQRGCSIAILLLVVPPLLMPFLLKMRRGAGDGFALTVAIVGLIVSWLFVSIPVSILVYLDWFRSPSTGGLGRGMRNIGRVPVFLFGVIAVLLGVGALVWIANNLLIERQPVFGWASIEAVSAMVSIFFFGIYLIRLSFRNQQSEQPQEPDNQPIVPR
jgi:hypothetical protein